MRLRVAVPILLLSLCVMLAGLSLAVAQQGPGRPNLDVSGPAARRLNLPPLSKQPPPIRPAAPSPEPQRPQPAAPAPSPGAPTPGGTPPSPSPPAIPTPPPMSPTPPPMTPRAPVTPFETGIEFEPMPANARVTFNLEDADLPDLVRLISSITGKRFILPGSKARAIKATVYAPTKVTAAEAYQAFLSILQLNGMSVVPSGRYLKIVESAGIEGLPVATYTQGEATPADDRFITRMHHLENVPAEDVATLLGRFKSHEGNITAYAPTNTIIMTDMGSSIRRMLRIVEAIDIPRAGEQVWLEPVHYADATELASRLTEIFPVSEPGAAAAPTAAARPPTPAPGPPGSPTADGPSTVGSRAGEMRITKILADERTNSLVIIATERAYMRILEMVRALDIPLEGEGRVHVHYVQHGDAEDIAQALTSIVGGGGGGAPAGGPPGAARPAAAAAAGAAGGGTPFEGSVRISAHKPTNSLVITSSLHDYATLRNVISRLDVERRQVFIEAVIMELQVKRGTKAGLSLHSGIPDTPAAGALSLFGFNARGSLGFPNPADQETLTGLALGVRGPAIQEATQAIGISIPAFGVVLNALSTAGDVNVLSTPHIMAMDNVEAEISVGADIPLQTNSGFGSLPGLGTAGLPGAGTGATAGLLGGALGALTGGLGGAGAFGAGAGARRKVGTKIHITPHINEANEIRLEIEEEISERQASEGTLGVVSVAERTAKTQVVVRDQQTVVIGGLMRDSISTEETKVPILGDIPLIGILFRRTNRTVEKTNLLLFLTPYIIRSSADLRSIFERKMRERQEFIDRYFVFGDQEYTPPIDYSRTRGLVAEIMNELAAVDEERTLLEEAASRPPPDHVARRAVGAVDRSTEEPNPGDVIIAPESPQGRIVSEDDVGGAPPSSQAPPPTAPPPNAPAGGPNF